MAAFHLTYNPFLVQAGLTVKREKEWIPVDEGAGLDSIYRKRLQHWLYENNRTGESFFDQLCASSGDEAIEILFSGTKEDMSDLCRAAESYGNKNQDVQIVVRPFDQEWMEKYGSVEKLQELCSLAQEIRLSAYWNLLPDSVRRCLEGISLPVSQTGLLLDLPLWETKRTKLFAANAWQLVCLKFRYETMQERAMRNVFRAFSETFRETGNRELERDRFLLLCQCREAALASLPHTQDSVRKFLLEYGLYDLPVFLLSEQEISALDGENSEKDSARLRDARNTVLLYSERYALQTRLRKICDTLQQTLRQEGYIKGKALFRTVEDAVRKACPFAGDRQVYDAYEWVCSLLERLNNFLEIQTWTSAMTSEGGAYA